MYVGAARIRLILLALVGALLSAPAHAAGYVRSVEYVEIVLASGATTASANLTKSQIVANCVPFASALMTGTGFRRMLTDVSLTAGAPPTVDVARDQSGGGTTVTVGVYVVEFDPTYVKVQQGTFTLANGAAGPANVGLGTAVSSLARAALVFYHQHATNANFTDVAIQGSFSTTSNLQFQRTGTGGAASGHWYVFEALAVSGVYAFAVQPMTFTFAAASGTSAALAPSVAASTTFLTGSYRSADATDEPDGGAYRLELTGCARKSEPVHVDHRAVVQQHHVGDRDRLRDHVRERDPRPARHAQLRRRGHSGDGDARVVRSIPASRWPGTSSARVRA